MVVHKRIAKDIKTVGKAVAKTARTSTFGLFRSGGSTLLKPKIKISNVRRASSIYRAPRNKKISSAQEKRRLQNAREREKEREKGRRNLVPKKLKPLPLRRSRQ